MIIEIQALQYDIIATSQLHLFHYNAETINIKRNEIWQANMANSVLSKAPLQFRHIHIEVDHTFTERYTVEM